MSLSFKHTFFSQKHCAASPPINKLSLKIVVVCADGSGEKLPAKKQNTTSSAAGSTKLLIEYLQGRDKDQKEARKEELDLQRKQMEENAQERREALALQTRQFEAQAKEWSKMMDLMQAMMETMRRSQ